MTFDFSDNANNTQSNQSSGVLSFEAPVKSPCISVCALDKHNICSGCFRTGDEIRDWGNTSNGERRLVLALCHEREKKVNPFL